MEDCIKKTVAWKEENHEAFFQEMLKTLTNFRNTNSASQKDKDKGYCRKLRSEDQETWVSSAEFFIENALRGAAVIKSLTKSVLHCSLYTFRGQCLGKESKHLGDNLKQSMQIKYSGIETCPI